MGNFFDKSSARGGEIAGRRGRWQERAEGDAIPGAPFGQLRKGLIVVFQSTRTPGGEGGIPLGLRSPLRSFRLRPSICAVRVCMLSLHGLRTASPDRSARYLFSSFSWGPQLNKKILNSNTPRPDFAYAKQADSPQIRHFKERVYVSFIIPLQAHRRGIRREADVGIMAKTSRGCGEIALAAAVRIQAAAKPP